jgi:hypothetical protein
MAHVVPHRAPPRKDNVKAAYTMNAATACSAGTTVDRTNTRHVMKGTHPDVASNQTLVGTRVAVASGPVDEAENMRDSGNGDRRKCH